MPDRPPLRRTAAVLAAVLAATLTAPVPAPASAGTGSSTGSGTGVAQVDPTAARAHWIDAATLLWPGDLDPDAEYSLVSSPDASLRVESGALKGEYRRLPLEPAPHLPDEEQRSAFPHLAELSGLALDADRDRVTDALTGRLALVEEDTAGRVTAATGVQIPGVLDDVYAAAADAPVGPRWNGDGAPELALWAPTARDVRLDLYPGGSGTDSGRAAAEHVEMERDPATGMWTVTGDPSWKGRPYTFTVTVYAPAADGGKGAVVENTVTDPYSLALADGGDRSRLVDLSDARHTPAGWDDLAKPDPVALNEAVLYELHVRDFSASDPTVPERFRGTYRAFERRNSDGARELRALAGDGVTHVHLLPTADFGSVPADPADRRAPDCDLDSFAPDSEEQQACVGEVRGDDAYNWGYDPVHYTVPEGSYATGDPAAGHRSMVAALNRSGLRTVMDVVYNHTHRAGQDAGSVLDRVVPGYYHRLREDGSVADSTCCPNTAPEHMMMDRLVVDSVVTWAREYKVDGFRFDLMGHHPKENILRVREALDGLTLEEDGVDGSSIVLYGEGWDFGEVAGGARFEQATQANMAGTGIATFNDRLRDAVRGGGPFDADPRVQGLGSGLAGDPNGAPANGGEDERRARLLGYEDLVKTGLTGTLRDVRFASSRGGWTTGGEVDYNGAPAGYTAAPGEALNYAAAHDNETLYDALAFKLPQGTRPADRVRMQNLSLATVLFAQGPAFLHAGGERLRSKSLDRDSYDSGDWFNRLLWDCEAGNNFGSGLPPAWSNDGKWEFARPLLADPALRADCSMVETNRAVTGELLRIRASTPAFSLGTADEVQERMSFPAAGRTPGVIAMRIGTAGLEGEWDAVTVVFNATPEQAEVPVEELRGSEAALHPVQADSADAAVRGARVDADTGTAVVPARTTAVFVE